MTLMTLRLPCCFGTQRRRLWSAAGATVQKQRSKRYIGCGAAVCQDGPSLRSAQERLRRLREIVAPRGFASSVNLDAPTRK
jgi:hypothetical protein